MPPTLSLNARIPPPACPTPTCPAVGIPVHAEKAALIDHRCVFCDAPLFAPSTDGSVHPPADPDPESLPTHLAHAWAAFRAESHPRVRVNHLVDTADLLVRFVVLLAVADLAAAGDDRVPRELSAQIRDTVERPTLGRWVAIARAVAASAPKKPRVLSPAFYQLLRDGIEPHFERESPGTPDTSLLVLRNDVAHVGGLTRVRAQQLVDAQMPRVAGMLRAVRDALEGVELLVVDGSGTRRLVGVQPAVDAVGGLASGAWIRRGSVNARLSPFLTWDLARRTPTGGSAVLTPPACPQVYARSGETRLDYTAVGHDAGRSEGTEVAAFRRTLRLDEPRAQSASIDGFAPDAFLDDARKQHFVGRSAELARVKVWVKEQRDTAGDARPVAWIAAGPGTGKSALVSRIADDLSNAKDRLVFLHRFRGGDARNSRRSFLRLLQSALASWPPLAGPPVELASTEGQALEADVVDRLRRVAELQPSKTLASPPEVIVLADGLDEVAATDPDVGALLGRLSMARVLVVASGRPQRDLERAMAGAVALFPGGLPPMTADDIRQLLLARLEPATRVALLRRDTDVETGAQNRFIDAVVARADGLPLYVHLVAEDLGSGAFGVGDESRLPAGLSAYYDALVTRMGISAARRDLTLLICVLARAEEPLDTDALGVLLAGRPRDPVRWRRRVDEALGAGTALIRRSPTKDGGEGWTLYHQGFREYVSGEASGLADVVLDTQELLVELAADWRTLPPGNLRNHLFRWGTEYALWWGGAAGVDAARSRLSDIAYLCARTEALPATESSDLGREGPMVLAALAPLAGGPGEFRPWAEFLRGRAHLLRRGTPDWPTTRVLLQLASEQPADGPIASGALDRLSLAGWPVLRRVGQSGVRDDALLVLEGHTGAVIGAMPLVDGGVLSWSADGTLRRWNLDTGDCVAVMSGHRGKVEGVTALPDGRVLSRSNDRALRVWNPSTGACLSVVPDQPRWMMAVRVLPGSRVASCGLEGPLTISELDSGRCVHLLSGHEGVVDVVSAADGRRLISAGYEDQALRIWDCATGECLAASGSGAEINGLVLLRGGLAACWQKDGTVSVWDLERAACVKEWRAHRRAVEGAIGLQDGSLLTWSGDRTLAVWDPADGRLRARLEGHEEHVIGAIECAPGVLLSWDWDGTVRRWDAGSGASLAVHRTENDIVGGAIVVDRGRVLSWAGCALFVHNDAEEPESVLEGHAGEVLGAFMLPGDRVVSWSADGTLRLWDIGARDRTTLAATHIEPVASVHVVRDGLVVSADSAGLMVSWDPATGRQITAMGQPLEEGPIVLPDGRLLTWALDGSLRTWDPTTGDCTATWTGHTDCLHEVRLLADGTVASWSMDETLRFWNPRTGECLTVVKVGATVAGYITDSLVTLVGEDGKLRTWSAPDGRPLVKGARVEIDGGADGVLPGRVLLTSAGVIDVVDPRSGVRVARWVGHTRKVGGAVAAGSRVVTWGQDKTLRAWDPETGVGIVLRKFKRVINDVEALGNGDVLCLANDGTLTRWDPVGGTCLATWAVTRPDSGFAVRPGDGGFVAVGRAGGIELLSLLEPGGPVAVWHADGEWEPSAVLMDGTVIAACGGEVAFLRPDGGRAPA